jgi:WW domain-containing oxidoreductase
MPDPEQTQQPSAHRFGAKSTAEQVTEGLDLSGRTYLLTGSNSGLGLETLRVLGLRGARVIAAARDLDKAAGALEATGTSGVPVACEHRDPASVRACVEAVRALEVPLDGIVANAGIMALGRLDLVHGIEAQFFVNHVTHFMLVTALLDRLAPDGRVVMVSSHGHHLAPRGGIRLDDLAWTRRYSAWSSYGQSKLANILFARALSERMEGTAQTANALHPGTIFTNLGRHLPGYQRAGYRLIAPLVTKSVPQGAATQCYLATHPDLATTSGRYFQDCATARPSRVARDSELAARLWSATEDIVAKLA